MESRQPEPRRAGSLQWIADRASGARIPEADSAVISTCGEQNAAVGQVQCGGGPYGAIMASEQDMQWVMVSKPRPASGRHTDRGNLGVSRLDTCHRDPPGHPAVGDRYRGQQMPS